MARRRPVLLASTNPAKVAKLRWLLETLEVAAIDLAALPPRPAPEETGDSFLANARIKAAYWSNFHDGKVIASDGGVTIPALGDHWDRLMTGRAAGPGSTGAGRAEHLLSLMRGRTGEERRVAWTEALAVAQRGVAVAAWEASGTEGMLTDGYDPAGAIPGFWVYSLWRFPELGRRYVELDATELATVDLTWNRLREEVQRWWRAQARSHS